VLPKLTVEDLKDIGVTRVGDRRKLLEAIAALRERALPSPVVEQPSAPGPAAGPSPEVLGMEHAGRSHAREARMTRSAPKPTLSATHLYVGASFAGMGQGDSIAPIPAVANRNGSSPTALSSEHFHIRPVFGHRTR
jgi:hypothetical protein